MIKTDTLIRTKLQVPFLRLELVPRPRLQTRIAEGLRGPLTLITAPAGFGKTTLVASCVTGCGMPLAWLSLDRNDNQTGRFLNYVIAALQGVDNRISSEAAQLMAGMQHVPNEAVLTSLINDLDTPGDEVALVLDDYQSINNQDVHEVVTFLLEHCPNSLHVVIVSRSDPPLPLVRLRGRGQMVELRTADLRFTNSEAAEFLNEVMGLNLDADSITTLEERTEGWVAGLQMAAITIQSTQTMRDRKDVLGFIEGFSGTNRYILDYLLEEVLASQSPDIQHFLLYTSILERLSAPLCDAILADDEGPKKTDDERYMERFVAGRSASMLEHIERANLFLVPLDDERIWYRYHNLFAELLQSQLRKSLGDQAVARLHLRASEWYEQNGHILEAIQHASLASDDEMVEGLIEKHYMDMVNRGEMSQVRYWMGKLSKELIYRRPWLCLYEALNRSWYGQLEEANILLNEAEKHIRAKTSDEATTPKTKSILGYHAYIKSRVTAMQGNTQRAIEYSLVARDNIPADNLALQNEVSITLGYEYFLYGDFVNANKTLHQTIQSGYTARAINNPVAAYAILARIQMYQGKLNKAYDLLQKAAHLIQEAGGQYFGATGLVEAGIAALLCERNLLQVALDHIKEGLDFLPWWGKADDLALAYITLWRIQLVLGNLTEAAGAMEKADQLIQTCGVFSEARSAVEATQVKSWLLERDWLTIDRWVASHNEKEYDSDDPFQFIDELAQITQARVFMAQDNLDDAIGLLHRLEDNARSFGRKGRLIEIMILKSLAQQAVGDTTQMDISLSNSLALAEPEGYLRIFLDEGRTMQDLIRQWMTNHRASPLRDFASFLLSQFDTEPHVFTTVQAEASPASDPSASSKQRQVEPEVTPTKDALVEPLSERELEVLQLIALGKTNKEIARQLIVAPGTIKAHAASIYRKLDVANRTEAVARARQLGLLG
jgi:LuxR family maltose regulon positive regulatory protein